MIGRVVRSLTLVRGRKLLHDSVLCVGTGTLSSRMALRLHMALYRRLQARRQRGGTLESISTAAQHAPSSARSVARLIPEPASGHGGSHVTSLLQRTPEY
jgi:hypothetical protein